MRKKEVDALRSRFDSLVEEVQEEVRSYAAGLVRSRELGDDLFMDAWWEVLRYFPGMRSIEPIPFKAYFKRVIESLASKHYRRHKWLRSIDQTPESALPSSDEVASWTEAQITDTSLLGLIQELEPGARQAILLAAENLSPEEAAEIMQLRVSKYVELLEGTRAELQRKLLGEPEPLSEEEEEEYLSVREIAYLLDRPWSWVMQRLAWHKGLAKGYETMRGNVNFLFPASVLPRLETLSGDVRVNESDWVTIAQMSRIIECPSNWVTRRVFMLSHSGELRISVNGLICAHYPPGCVEEMRKIRQDWEKFPSKDGFLTLHDLAIELQRSRVWIYDNLVLMGIKPNKRRVPNGLHECYPPDVIPKLRELSEAYPKAEGWLTINMLAEELGFGRVWVEVKLEELGAQGERRFFEHSGRNDLCFSPTILRELLAIAKRYQAPPRGWHNANSLREKVGKSNYWIDRRLTELQPETQQFLDERGNLREYFPPWVLRELRRMKREQERRKAYRWYNTRR